MAKRQVRCVDLLKQSLVALSDQVLAVFALKDIFANLNFVFETLIVLEIGSFDVAFDHLDPFLLIGPLHAKFRLIL